MYTTLKEVLRTANELNMAIGAFNTHNLEMLPAIIGAAEKQSSPVIIQTSIGTANFVGHQNLVSVCKNLAEQFGIDVVLHLDHAKDHAEIRKAIVWVWLVSFGWIFTSLKKISYRLKKL